MNKSEGISNLAKALVGFQSEVSQVGFDSKNPFLKNKYASLGAVISTSKPYLTKYGLSVSQLTASNPQGQVGVTTLLMHVSGEFIEETCLMTPEKNKGVNDAQSAGIAITYCRRYGWMSVLGLVGDEDTDAHVEDSQTETKSEVKERVFSIEALEAVIGYSVADANTGEIGQLATNHEEAKQILDLSVLPENVKSTTVTSWLKYFVAGGGSMLDNASVANEAYIKAKNGGKK